MMQLKKLTTLYFSPTGTTEKIAKAVSAPFEKACPSAATHTLDITVDRSLSSAAPDASSSISFYADELLVIGLPVYGGRIPLLVESALRRLQGAHTPFIPLVVYGNRAYEDSLLELTELLSEQGFVLLGAGAFIGEHSYGNDIAAGRPDEADLTAARQLGVQLYKKLSALESADLLPALSIPGNHPYQERKAAGAAWAPDTLDRCTGCGLCAQRCPVQIIDSAADYRVVSPEKCLHCCACVKTCPIGAKVMNAEPYNMFHAFLAANCGGVRREPEVFI